MGRRDLCLAVSVEVVRLPSVWAFDPLDYAPTGVLAALDRFLTENGGIWDEVDNGRPGDLAALNAMLANLGSGRPNRAQRRAQNFCQKLEVK
jgi:hypothetical protein